MFISTAFPLQKVLESALTDEPLMSRLNSGPRIQSYSNNIGGEISVMFSTLGSPFVPGSSVTKAPPDYSSPVLRVCYVGAGYVGTVNHAMACLPHILTVNRWY